MSSFTKLEVTVDDQGYFITTEPFTYYTYNKEETYEVPAGFKTNFASVPSVIQSLFDRKDIFNSASVLHDYLYAHAIVPREKADALLREGMLVLGCKKSTAFWFHLAVRMFGSKFYGKAAF